MRKGWERGHRTFSRKQAPASDSVRRAQNAGRSAARESVADRTATDALKQSTRGRPAGPLQASHRAGAPSPFHGRGEAVPEAIRMPLEAGFGHDFSSVRVLSSERDALLARSLGARAATFGDRIVFAPGHWAPGTTEGRALLAHELAHVAMQACEGQPRLDAKGLDEELDAELKAAARDPAGLDPNSPEYARTLQSYAYELTHDEQGELLPEPKNRKAKAGWKKKFDKTALLAQRILERSGPAVEQKEDRGAELASYVAEAGLVDEAMRLATLLAKRSRKYVYDAVLARPDKVSAEHLATIVRYHVAPAAAADHPVLSRLARDASYARSLGAAKVNAALREIVVAYAPDPALPATLARVLLLNPASRPGFTKWMLANRRGALLRAISNSLTTTVFTAEGVELERDEATLGWAIANKQRVTVDDIVAMCAAAGVNVRPPKKLDAVSARAWLDANTEKIGAALRTQFPREPVAAEALFTHVADAFMFHVDPAGPTNVQPDPHGKIGHLKPGGPQRKQLEVDCDVLATYGMRLLVASGFTPVGYMSIVPTDSKRAAHVVALLRHGETFHAISNMETRALAARDKDAALRQLRNFALEAYDRNRPLVDCRVYYQDSDARGTLPDAVENENPQALRPDLGC